MWQEAAGCCPLWVGVGWAEEVAACGFEGGGKKGSLMRGGGSFLIPEERGIVSQLITVICQLEVSDQTEHHSRVNLPPSVAVYLLQSPSLPPYSDLLI